MYVCKEYGRQPPTFADASLVAQTVLDSGFAFDVGSIFYNRFKYDSFLFLFQFLGHFFVVLLWCFGRIQKLKTIVIRS